jgi:hypothetical protein
MTINAYGTIPKLQRRLHGGPLGVHIDLYAARLLKEGHCRQSAWRCLRVVSDFSHWLERKRIGLGEVDERTVERYQVFRLRNRCPFLSDKPALDRLLSVLRGIDAIQPNTTVVDRRSAGSIRAFDSGSTWRETDVVFATRTNAAGVQGRATLAIAMR